jgi:hypothetical protein
MTGTADLRCNDNLDTISPSSRVTKEDSCGAVTTSTVAMTTNDINAPDAGETTLRENNNDSTSTMYTNSVLQPQNADDDQAPPHQSHMPDSFAPTLSHQQHQHHQRNPHDPPGYPTWNPYYPPVMLYGFVAPPMPHGYSVPPSDFNYYNNYNYNYIPAHQQHQVPMAMGFVAAPLHVPVMSAGYPAYAPEMVHGHDPRPLFVQDHDHDHADEADGFQGHHPPAFHGPLYPLPVSGKDLAHCTTSNDNPYHHNYHPEGEEQLYSVPLSAWTLPQPENDSVFQECAWLAEAWLVLKDIRDRTTFDDSHCDNTLPTPMMAFHEFVELEKRLEQSKYQIYHQNFRHQRDATGFNKEKETMTVRKLELAQELAGHFDLADYALDAARNNYYDLDVCNPPHAIADYTLPTVKFLLRYCFGPNGIPNGRILAMDLAHIQHELQILSFQDTEHVSRWGSKNVLAMLRRLDFIHHDQVQANLAHYLQHGVIDTDIATCDRILGYKKESAKTLQGYVAIYLGLVPPNYSHFSPCDRHDSVHPVWTISPLVQPKRKSKKRSDKNKKKQPHQHRQLLKQQEQQTDDIRADTPTESCTTLSSVNSTPSSVAHGHKDVSKAPGAETNTQVCLPESTLEIATAPTKPTNAWAKKKQEKDANNNQKLPGGGSKKCEPRPVQELTSDNFPPLPAPGAATTAPIVGARLKYNRRKNSKKKQSVKAPQKLLG